MVTIFAGKVVPDDARKIQPAALPSRMESGRTGTLLLARYRLHLLPGLVALCAVCLLVEPVAFAEDEGPRQPGVGTAVQADQEIQTILQRVSRQITSGHTLAPEGDNALATWGLLRNSVSPAEPNTKRALIYFIAQSRSRAAEEQAAGRIGVAVDLLLFAEEAAGLLQHEGVAPDPSPVAARPDAPADSTPPAPIDATPPQRDVAVHDAPHPTQTTPTPQQQAASAALASRGDAMMALQDISAARLFYERAANAGSARAAMALGETYNPTFLARLGAVGTKPNPAMAEEWYRKAAALGSRSAEDRLRTLGLEAAK
jgi:hypothetical protein